MVNSDQWLAPGGDLVSGCMIFGEREGKVEQTWLSNTSIV